MAVGILASFCVPEKGKRAAFAAPLALLFSGSSSVFCFLEFHQVVSYSPIHSCLHMLSIQVGVWGPRCAFVL